MRRNEDGEGREREIGQRQIGRGCVYGRPMDLHPPRKGWSKMATRLDEKIEQLGRIVDRCMHLCDATWNGVRWTLPASHQPAERHRFPVEFLQAPQLLAGVENFGADIRTEK